MSSRSNRSLARKLAAAACAAALCVAAALGAGGCSQVQSQLGMVAATEPQIEQTSTLSAGTVIQDGILTVGINGSNSPYGGTNASGEVIGFDVDMAASLAGKLGCKLRIVDVGADGKTAVADGTVDVALSAKKTGASKDISYSDAYINDGLSLFCLVKNLPDNVASADLSKEPVLVQGSSAAALTVQEALGVDAVSVTPTMQEAFAALERGEHSYLVADAVIGSYYARDYSDIVRVDFLSVNDVSPVYAVTAAGNQELADAVAGAMSAITTDGTLRVVVAKWLGNQGSTLLPGALQVDDLPQKFDPKPAGAAKEDTGTKKNAS